MKPRHLIIPAIALLCLSVSTAAFAQPEMKATREAIEKKLAGHTTKGERFYWEQRLALIAAQEQHKTDEIRQIARNLVAYGKGDPKAAWSAKALALAADLAVYWFNNEEDRMKFDWQLIDGFPCGNFAIATNVSQQGRIAGQIIRNPGVFGKWLEPLATSSFHMSTTGTSHTLDELTDRTVTRRWPFSYVSGIDADTPALAVSATVFVPVRLDDEAATTLPCIMVDLKLENTGRTPINATVGWDITGFAASDAQLAATSADGKAILGPVAIAADTDGAREIGPQGLQATVTVAPGETQSLHWVLASYDPDGAAARRFANQMEMADYTLNNWDYLKNSASAFDKALPTAGDAELDEALRWYMGAGVYLTRCMRSGAILTMGYVELNQRDSYWSSWAHLVLWPSIERRMIEESAASLQPDGKMPTCILPQIERPDDLDINAYFILRTLRYVNYYNDHEMAYRLWPTLMRALHWLIDQSPDGLPVQGSYWGDWKDVQGVEDRKHSPHACFLYIATLDRSLKLGKQLGKEADCAEIEGELVKAREAIDKDVADGGLWNGKYYVQVWENGREDDKILLDQTVGILYGLVDATRAASVLDALNKNRCRYGIRETWPYYPASFGYEPGTYHNGAVWPYLSFVGAWAHMQSGRTKDGIAIIKDVAHADLVAHGDYQPNEYVNAETGENCGPSIQGWDAALFGALYFGLEGKEIP